MTHAELTQAIADLTAARELIATPERWCKHLMALNDRHCSVDPRSPSARRFCVMGAFMRISDDNYSRYTSAYELLRPVTGVSVDTMNDAPQTTHDDVIDVLTLAIVAGADLVEVEG